MHVNKEIGVIQDIAAIGTLPADLMSLSAHKTYGPMGIGALHVLREFERVGGSKAVKVDVRLVCATNRELDNKENQRQLKLSSEAIKLLSSFSPARATAA